MGKSLEDIQKLIRDQEIKMVDFKLTDIDGRWRHLAIPAERLLMQLVARCRKTGNMISRLPHPAEFAEYYDL